MAHDYESDHVISAWNYKDNAERELSVLERLAKANALRIEAERGFTVQAVEVLDA